MDFRDVIIETRTNFESRPENHMNYARIVSSPFMLAPRFKVLIEDQDILFSEGSVVWGTIVQANANLFYQGVDDLPAVILYSLDERIDSKPKIIKKVARGLFSIKGKRTDPDLQEFSDMLKSERTPTWKIPFPPRISNYIQCFYTTALIIRDHLPKGYLKMVCFHI